MNFHYSAQQLTGREKKLQRFFEILPGAMSWSLIVGAALLSFFKPFIAAIVIIVFNLYWLFRLFYATIFLVLSYGILARENRTDWVKEIRALQERRPQDLSTPRRRQEAEALLRDNLPIPDYEDIRHVVIIPIVREAEEVVEPGLRALCHQTLASQNMLVVLAVEERSDISIRQGALRLAEKYKSRFLDLLVVLHPDGAVGEAQVKGANTTHAAKAAAKYFQNKNIPFDNIIVSCFDADSVAGLEYFACLTYHFMACAKRARASFQPIPMYHNNIWAAPGFSRVLETASSFFIMVEATDASRLVTFSSHSMSFRALVEVGYWPVDMVSDDSAIFWKSLIHYDGDYYVVPMYVTVSMDMVAAKSWWKTAVSVYKQKRRWAWGVENFPLTARAFLRAQTIPWRIRFKHLFKMLEGHLSWATWAFLLTFIGWLPVLCASKRFSQTVLYYSIQRITGTIFNLSLLSFLVSITLSLLLLPQKQIRHSFFKKLWFALEWATVPFIAVFFSALPALDAQTHMMLGRALGFWVTDKGKSQRISGDI